MKNEMIKKVITVILKVSLDSEILFCCLEAFLVALLLSFLSTAYHLAWGMFQHFHPTPSVSSPRRAASAMLASLLGYITCKKLISSDNINEQSHSKTRVRHVLYLYSGPTRGVVVRCSYGCE
uniref:Uncharacterized protein n=1 Tax=Helicotheca tamesis TaxID=374047 RepID=A0A7S2H6X0_9STRA